MAQKKKEKISKKVKKIILKGIKEKALTAIAQTKPAEPLKLGALKIKQELKPEKLEEKIEGTSGALAPVPAAIAPTLQPTSPPQIIETASRNYLDRARERRYASQRAERAAAPETAAPRTDEAEKTPYSTIVLYGGARQQQDERARAYEPGESTMRRAGQIANRLASRVPQPEIEQNQIFENKIPDQVLQNTLEKVHYEIAKPEEKKPKGRYPWEA